MRRRPRTGVTRTSGERTSVNNPKTITILNVVGARPSGSPTSSWRNAPASEAGDQV